MPRIPILRTSRLRDDDPPRQLGRAGLDALMRDPRRLDGNHPEQGPVVKMIQRGFDLVFPTPDTAGQATDPGGPFARSLAKQIKNIGGLDDLPTKAREDLGRQVILDALRVDGFKLPSGFADDNPPRQWQRCDTEIAQTTDQTDSPPEVNEQPGINAAETSSNESKLPPPTKEPIDLPNLYKALEFDPNGRRESIHSILNLGMAKKILKQAGAASRLTIKNFPNSRGHNDRADAYRHALWSYTIAREFGHKNAKKFTDAHEVGDNKSGIGAVTSRYTGISGTNTPGERAMDLYNNAIGRRLARDPRNHSRTAHEVIFEALKNGNLQPRPFKIRRTP